MALISIEVTDHELQEMLSPRVDDNLAFEAVLITAENLKMGMLRDHLCDAVLDGDEALLLAIRTLRDEADFILDYYEDMRDD